MAFATREEAENMLRAMGFTRSTIEGSPYWTKRGMTHGWEPYETVAVASVREYPVTGGQPYFDIWYD